MINETESSLIWQWISSDPLGYQCQMKAKLRRPGPVLAGDLIARPGPGLRYSNNLRVIYAQVIFDPWRNVT